jgi:hypothetical protein
VTFIVQTSGSQRPVESLSPRDRNLQWDNDDQVREYLLSAGTTPAEIERILDNLRLLWGSYDSLTERRQVEFDESRLDQEHFFDHQSQR